MTTGKISYPPYQGWHPAGTAPHRKFTPFLRVEGMLFDEPVEERDGRMFVRLAVADGDFETYQVIPVEERDDEDDGSSVVSCRVELA